MVWSERHQILERKNVEMSSVYKVTFLVSMTTFMFKYPMSLIRDFFAPSAIIHSPLDLVHAPVESVKRVCDAFELLALVDLFGVGAAHDAEEVGEAELDGAVQVLRLRVVQVSQDAVRTLLGLLGRFSFFLQFLAGKRSRDCQRQVIC